jgi:hypothetical protein
MRDLHKTIASIEHTMTRGLDRKAAPPKEKPKPSIRAWRAPVDHEVRYPVERVFKPKETPMTTLTARAIKVTVPLDVAEVAALPAPDGVARTKLVINCEGKSFVVDIAMKSLRKAKSTISANGVENVFVMIQGRLKGKEVVEAGLVAQVKAPKPTDGSQATLKTE